MSVKHCSLVNVTVTSAAAAGILLNSQREHKSSSVSSSLKTLKGKIVLSPHRNQCGTDCRDSFPPQNKPSIAAEHKTKYGNMKYGTDFTDFRGDASALKKCHHLKNNDLRSGRLRNGRLSEGSARRWGTWTSVLLGAAAAACHHVSQAAEECAAKHRVHVRVE